MVCPQCRQPLSQKEVVTTDNQKALVYECFNCGGHFVPPLIANLIPQSTAANLDSISAKNTTPPSSTVICPICQTTMTGVTDNAVPRGVTVYSCPDNHGNYFPLHQLFAFKKAQRAKLEYHELWGIPLKSIFTVLLPIVAIFTAVTAIPFTLEQIQSSQESRVKAGEIFSSPLVSPISSTQVLISFTTKVPAESGLELTTPTTDLNFPGAVTPQTTHIFNLNDLQPATDYSYHVIVNGKAYGPYTFKTPSL